MGKKSGWLQEITSIICLIGMARKLGWLVLATLSNAATGCFASKTLLRNCGARCFGRAAGHVRADCIANCLDATLHIGSCARCYGARSDCTTAKCLQPCARLVTGAACSGCVHAKCGGDCH